MAKDNKNHSYGRHELLDRSCLIMGMVAEHLMEHPDLKKDEEKLAQAAHDALFELYQLLGARTLGPGEGPDDGPGGGDDDDDSGTRH